MPKEPGSTCRMAIGHGPWPTADGDRGLGCPPALPGATHRDTWLTFGSLFRRLRPRAPGCTPLGGALGSSQVVFPVLFALRCQPFLSPRGDASPSVLGTRPTSVAHLFCAPSTGGCILAQGIQCMHRRSPMQIPSDAYHACSCVQDPVNYWAPRGSLSFLGAQMLGPCVPPRTCICHAGHIPWTLGLSTQAATQEWGVPLRGAHRVAHGSRFYFPSVS